MKMVKMLFAMLLVAVLSSCGKKTEPRHIVILPDVSGSIDRQALDRAFKAIDELVSHLHRGDQMAIIPILGDARAEASGRITRFSVPTKRGAYDADLRNFRSKLRISLNEMKIAAIARPGAKTDILGSIRLANDEFKNDLNTTNSNKTLVLLTDEIQEDKYLDFGRDNRLADPSRARELARRLARRDGIDLEGTIVYLGFLQSKEYASLSYQRRQAIEAFWATYFGPHNEQLRFLVDGPELLKKLN